MKYIKKYGTSILIIIVSILIGMLPITTLNYFDLISDQVLSLLEILLTIISLLISGFITGKHSKEKGWLEGLKVGMLLFLFLILLNIIFIKDFSFKLFIYLIILLLPIIVGSMMGILKK